MSQDVQESQYEHDPSKQLVQMANDIGNFFRSEPDREEAIAAIARHIGSFWTRSMRRKITAIGEAGLDEVPREALRRLASQSAPAVFARPPPGGDAG
jgi:formate dehydrogenase subunit delta